MKSYIAVMLAGLACGCSTGEKKDEGLAKENLGTVWLDVRRADEGGLTKRAIGYSFVLYSLDRKAGDADFVVMAEPKKDFPNDPRAEGAFRDDPDMQNANVISRTLPAGKYGLDIFAFGACVRVTDIVVLPGRATRREIMLDTGGSVEGVVVGAASGLPIPNVAVFRPLDRGYGVEPSDWDPATAMISLQVVHTADSGRFLMQWMPPGEHLLILYHPDLGYVEKKVNVVDGRKLQLKVIEIGRKTG